MLALAHAQRQQAAHDVVDPALDGRLGVGAIAEQERDGLGRARRLLVEQQAERDPRARLHALQARQPRQLARRLLRQQTCHADRARSGPEHRARDAEADAGGEVQADAEPRADRRRRVGLVLVDGVDELGQVALPVAPVRPVGDERPRPPRRRRADDEPEVPRRQRQLVDLRPRRRPAHRAHGARRGDLVDLPHDRQDRQLHVGERHEPVLDDEAARQHAVVGDELVDEVRERGPRPGDPAARLEELALALARQQRLAVVQRHEEVELLAQRLDGVQQAKARAARPRRQRGPAQDVVGEEAGAAHRDLLRDPERQRAERVDRRAEGHEARQSRAAAVGGGLVAEHAALGVAAEVHLAAGDRAHAVDRVADRHDMVGERALQAALLALGSAEVDHPGIGGVLVQDGDGARRRRDVVDVGGEHHRRHEHDRRTGIPAPVGRREVAAQPVDPPLCGDLVRRRLLAGLQAAEARHLERVLRGRAEPRHGPHDDVGQKPHAGDASRRAEPDGRDAAAAR